MKVTINGVETTTSKVKLKDIQQAKCWDCGREYDSVYHRLGGIAGRCNACDSEHWVVSPENYKKLRNNKKIKAVM